MRHTGIYWLLDGDPRWICLDCGTTRCDGGTTHTDTAWAAMKHSCEDGFLILEE